MNYHSSTRLVGAFAAIGAATVVTQADASIVFVDFSANPSSAIPFTIDGVYINVVTGVTGTSAGTAAGWDINPYFTGTTGATPALSIFATTTGDANRAIVISTGAAALAMGTPIGGSSTFGTGVQSGANFHAAGGYLGFRFTNETTGQINFGWALFTSTGANPPSAGSIRITGFAFENTGLAINAGDTGAPIPEPSTIVTLGMMAAGALGLRQWRRRQAA